MSNRAMKDSGIEWIGDIPQDWNIGRVKDGFLRKNSKANQENPIVLSLARSGIKIRDVSKNEGQLAENFSNYNPVAIGDLLLNPMDLYSGANCNVSRLNGVISPAYINLKSKPGFNVHYFDYYFKTQYWSMAFFAHGKGISFDHRWTLNNETLRRYYIPIPSLHEQQAIATYLDEQAARLDQLIQDQQQVIEDWKSYKQSLITETVTKGLNPEVEMKDSGIEWMGEIPNHWEVKRLRNLGTTKSGLSNKTKEDFGFGNPFVNYRDVYKKDIIHATGLVDSTNDEIIKFSIKRGDVLFTGSSETIQELGMSSVALEDVEDSTYSGFLIRFKPYPGQLHPEFSRFLFRSAAMREFLIRDDNSVTRSNLSQKKLKNMPVIIPPLHEQQQIADFLDEKCSKIDQLIEDKQRLIEDLKAYKQSLIHECVTGKKEIV